MESPLQNPPHVGHHPQPVFAVLCRFVDEIRLLACDPGVSLPLGKVDATPAQRGNEVSGVKVLEPLGTAQNGLAESRGDV